MCATLQLIQILILDTTEYSHILQMEAILKDELLLC